MVIHPLVFSIEMSIVYLRVLYNQSKRWIKSNEKGVFVLENN